MMPQDSCCPTCGQSVSWWMPLRESVDSRLDHARSCPALTPSSDDACTCGLVYRRQSAELAESLKQLTELKAIKRRMEANQVSDSARHYYESNKELCWKMAEDVLINYLKGASK